MKKTIDSFSGDSAYLSNFYACSFEYEGIVYPSSEHAYQAAKTLNMKARYAFTAPGMTASVAKHLGQALALRPNWDKIKLVVMADILQAKFLQNPELAKMLFVTDDAELIEGNTWNDTFWGVCNGKGKNFLGKLLMELRNKIAEARPLK